MQKVVTIIKRPGIIIATAVQHPRPLRRTVVFPMRTALRPDRREHPISDADNPVMHRIWTAITMVSLARSNIKGGAGRRFHGRTEPSAYLEGLGPPKRLAVLYEHQRAFLPIAKAHPYRACAFGRVPSGAVAQPLFAAPARFCVAHHRPALPA